MPNAIDGSGASSNLEANTTFAVNTGMNVIAVAARTRSGTGSCSSDSSGISHTTAIEASSTAYAIGNEMRSTAYSTDNSLTAPLNWMYVPALPASPQPGTLPFMLVYPSIRLGNASLPALEKGQISYKDYLVAEYRGSTDRAVAIYYEPPGCLRVLEPADGNDPALPDAMRKAAVLSQAALILPAPARAAQPMAQIFGAEPAHTWCYYYQKAGLARQQGDWQQVAALGSEAERLGLKPGLPAELLPFIEAHARLNAWERAAQFSVQAAAQKPDPSAVVCTLWRKLLNATPPSAQRSAAWEEVRVKLACDD